MSKIVNLTPEILHRIINEEKKKLKKSPARAAKKPSGKPEDVSKVAKQTKEVDAKDMAHTLANEVEHYKELQHEAARLAMKLSEINEAKQQIRSHILEQL